MALLEFEAVTKAYGAIANTAAVRVLASIDLAVEDGETIAVVGPSGCGKSTLLNLAGALDRPSAGTVKLEGFDLGRLSENDLADIRNRKIGFIFQQHHLLPQCTVLENILLPTLTGKRTREARQRDVAYATELLERVGLAGRRHHRPGQLSGGESQRVAVARSLINRPALLLADEPTGSLDQHSAQALGDLLTALNRDAGTALVVVTHSLELARRMNRVFRLENGHLSPEQT